MLADRAGVQIRDICVHEKGGERWLGMPSKQYTDKDGTEKWAPIVKFPDKTIWSRFQAATLKALDAHLKASPPADYSGSADLPF